MQMWNTLWVFMTEDKYRSLPGTQHMGGANLIFVDGHSEYRKWRDENTFKFRQPKNAWDFGFFITGKNTDFEWLRTKATVPRLGTKSAN